MTSITILVLIVAIVLAVMFILDSRRINRKLDTYYREQKQISYPLAFRFPQNKR